MLHEKSMKVTFSRDRDHLHPRAGFDIGAEPIPRHNGALHWSGASLGHELPPSRVFIRHSSRTRGFDGGRERSRHSETPAATGCGKKSMKVTRSLVSVVD